MQDGIQTDVCMLDFSKAFDKVGHKRLIEKLKWHGIQGEVNNWIKHFLNDRTQTVVVEGTKSSCVPVLSGVPQGSVLGPCLFLFYINDIARGLSSTVRLFADDTLLYLTIKCKDDASQLQRDLDKLVEWERTWEMEFHPSKCEVITITRKKKPIKTTYTMHGQDLKQADSIKYLGVTISHDLRWNKHVNNIATKANNSLNFLRRNINIGNPKLKERAYKALVRPLLEYGQTVWDPFTDVNINKLEMVQRRAARFTLCRYRRTSSVGDMLNHLNWQKLVERRKTARLVMFYKIHYQMVSVTMPLCTKQHQSPTRKENSQAYLLPHTSRDYYRKSFFPLTAREWNILPEDTVMASTPLIFRGALAQG